MKYNTKNGFSIDIDPWFNIVDGNRLFILTFIRFREEIGGELAGGEMELVSNMSPEALEMFNTQKTGTIEIQSDYNEGNVYKIPFLVIDISMTGNNKVKIKFVCLPESSSFLVTYRSNIFEKADIRKTIESLYPGEKKITCETDIQNSSLTFYQNNEVDKDICTKLCYSYKKDSVFAYGLEGLLIKEVTISDETSNIVLGNIYNLVGGFENGQYNTTYNPEIYSTSKDLNLQSSNISAIMKYGNLSYIGKDYAELDEIRKYNRDTYRSDLFMNITMSTSLALPTYRLGDVLKVSTVLSECNEMKWDYDYFLVRSNEFFLACDQSTYGANGEGKFTWTSELICIDNLGDTKDKLAQTNDGEIEQ